MSLLVPGQSSARACRFLLSSRSSATPTSHFTTRSSSLCIHRFNQERRKISGRNQIPRRWASTDTSAVAAGSGAPMNPKISGIVDQIGRLTLLETADLVASLKSHLNIPEMSFAAPASASGALSPGSAAKAEVEEDEAAPAPAAQSVFTLKLESFEAAAKPKVIKEVKSMLSLSLVDSKKFVESAPKVLKEGLPKEEAEKMAKVFEGLGAKVKME